MVSAVHKTSVLSSQQMNYPLTTVGHFREFAVARALLQSGRQGVAVPCAEELVPCHDADESGCYRSTDHRESEPGSSLVLFLW